ncbi:MAG: hypothetical protein B6I22_10135 [Desulfobacteraceae bacterium 4572_123]|nr:MAG: hypothetical protein B6I22_10135 [Desulfobacteraceae bacterium 4572_123]
MYQFAKYALSVILLFTITGIYVYQSYQTVSVEEGYFMRAVKNPGAKIAYADEGDGKIVQKRQPHMKQRAIHQIIYHYRDASAPGLVKITVDSYGDILSEKNYTLSDKQYDNVIHSLKKIEIGKAEFTEDNGCTGGTSEIISFFESRDEIISGTVYHCGGKDTGNLKGDIRAFADDVKKLVPDLDKLLQ